MSIINPNKPKEAKEAIRYLLWLKNNNWWSIRRMQARLWGCGAKLDYDTTKKLMDEVIEEGDPLNSDYVVLEKNDRDLYRCYMDFMPGVI